MSTPAQIAANQTNAAKSTGPADTTLTKFNAVKTGLTARHLTKLDNSAAYRELLTQLHAELAPVSILEKYLVERIALGMVRRCRGERLEAAFLDRDLKHKPDQIPALYDDKPAAPLTTDTVADLCNLAARYETATARRLQADVLLLQTLQRERRKAGFVS
jgi:hypothetical protein